MIVTFVTCVMSIIIEWKIQTMCCVRCGDGEKVVVRVWGNEWWMRGQTWISFSSIASCRVPLLRNDNEIWIIFLCFIEDIDCDDMGGKLYKYTDTETDTTDKKELSFSLYNAFRIY